MRTCAGFLFGVAPHTLFLAFFFLACAGFLLVVLRTRYFLLFSFGRVQCGSLDQLGVDPHTSFPTFFFWACACPFSTHFPCRSAHVIFCFFPFGVCNAVVWISWGWIRTRHFLLFSFLTCACPFSTHFPCRSAHAISCFFFFDVYVPLQHHHSPAHLFLLFPF